MEGGEAVESIPVRNARHDILTKVRRMVIKHLAGTPAKAYLFGSWARSEERRTSDIDIAIEFESHSDTNHRTLMQLRHALEESTIPYRIDVVDLHEADTHIIDKVRGEGILWDDASMRD